MIKQILGRLPRKPSKSTPNGTNSNDGGVTVGSSMNSSHGINSGGAGVNNLKGCLGRVNSTSNVLGNFDSKILENYDPEEEEPTMEPSWPHLQIVYEFLLRMLPPSRSMSSSLNPIEQSPIPSPIHVGGSYEHFNTLGGDSSKPKIRFGFSLLGHFVGKNSTKFMSRFGNLVREHIPPYYPSWLAIPLKLQDTVWETICDENVLPQEAKRKLMKLANTM
ncbi:hypothetical protein GIB67_016516 [Kingdonia uniflora]|uniref:Uncharacterized protein n=1 Tax=Kingdonia uniflora TaxID=39325 RepID=A0A7J7NQ89_9MAGN|nr:hypothetical protein GIB67_016516 [Kingdonia uniflora]